MRSIITRLSYVSARKPIDIVIYLRKLGFRVQIYSINFDGKRWVCWFVPGEDSKDVPPKDL